LATESSGSDRAVLVLGLGTLAASASLRATDPLLPGLALEFATTPGRAAAATTAFFIGYGLLQFVHGPIGDRYGKVRVVAIQAGLAAVATFLCALAPSLDLLTVARLVAGFFVGAVIPLSLAWIGDVVAYARRQEVLAKLMVWQIGGASVGLAAGGWFAEHLSWRWSFVAIAGLFTLASILLALEVRTNPAARASVAKAQRTSALGLLRDRWVRVILSSVFVEAMLGFAAMAFIPLHLHRSLGLNLALSGFLVTLMAMGGLFYALFASRLVPRFGERGLATYGGIAFSGALALLVLVPHVAVAVITLLAMGTGLYALHGTIQVHATQMAPQARGAGVSTFAFFLFAGQSIGTFLASLAVDAVGTTPILLAAAAGVWLLSMAFRGQLARRANSA
jgi:predicted MFS family arabinose efflux permease